MDMRRVVHAGRRQVPDVVVWSIFLGEKSTMVGSILPFEKILENFWQNQYFFKIFKKRSALLHSFELASVRKEKVKFLGGIGESF